MNFSDIFSIKVFLVIYVWMYSYVMWKFQGSARQLCVAPVVLLHNNQIYHIKYEMKFFYTRQVHFWDLKIIISCIRMCKIITFHFNAKDFHSVSQT